MNSPKTKKYAIYTVSALVVVFSLIIFLTFGAFLFFLNTPGTYKLLAVFQEENNPSYQIHVKYADYGGSFGSCKSEEGIKFLQYHFGMRCGGETTHVFLVNTNNPLEVYGLEKRPENLNCHVNGCPSKKDEEIEKFEFNKEKKTISWYGEELKLK
jgi:hypothetical protein